jgi:hypothetical protein
MSFRQNPEKMLAAQFLHISVSPSLMKDVTPYHDPTKLPRYKI